MSGLWGLSHKKFTLCGTGPKACSWKWCKMSVFTDFSYETQVLTPDGLADSRTGRQREILTTNHQIKYP
jgi:hypothetical protein